MAEARLPPAEWTQREDLAALVATLGPGNARYVGGAVRDTLLEIAVKDIDLATTLPPRKVMDRCEKAGIRCIPTGIDHGTVTAVLANGPVEITTLRRDVSTDGRRATVAFASDWRDDAARRDFTINALYADPASGELFDFFGGLEDLTARRVRFIGDARQRIREDHLRILRYFRFQARFGSEPANEPSENACSELAATLKGLSRERVGMEVMNLLALTDPAPTVARMAQLGVLTVILPEARPEALAELIATEVKHGIWPDPLRRLAALLPADADQAGQVAARLRLSGAQKKRLMRAAGRENLLGTGSGTSAAGGGAHASDLDAAGQHSSEQPPVPRHLPADSPTPRAEVDLRARALAYRLGREQALDQLLLAGNDPSPLSNWNIPVFPLKGGDVVAAGVTAGPKVARVLVAVEERWISAGFADDAIPAFLAAELAARP